MILLNYLNGFYVTLLEEINLYETRGDPYFIYPNVNNSWEKPSIRRTLVYNILIRLGDINRYLRNTDIAVTYYSNARNVNILKGHAYNQLALIAAAKNPFKCIYYYVRAIKSLEEPVAIAEANLKAAVKKFEKVSVLKDLFEGKLQNGAGQTKPNDTNVEPKEGIDWFHLSVIAFYCENFFPLIKPLCEFISQQDFKQSLSMDTNFVLMALDVFVDFAVIRDVRKLYSEKFSKELKDILAKLCEKYENQPEDKQDTYCDENGKLVPLYHDYQLRGFELLSPIHKEMNFNEAESASEIDSERLLCRVHFKFNQSFAKLLRPKKNRNLFLEGILNKTQND